MMMLGFNAIAQHFPRAAFWLAAVFAALFAIGALVITVGLTNDYLRAQRWPSAHECSSAGDGCYQVVGATVLEMSPTQSQVNPGELSVTLQVAGGSQETVLLAEPDASAWKRTGVSAGGQVQAVQWSGSLVAIDVGSTRLKTEDYPVWDPWRLMAAVIAAAVAAALLYAASTYRQMALIDTETRSLRRRGLRVDL